MSLRTHSIKEGPIYSSSRRKPGSIFLKDMDSGFRRNDGNGINQIFLNIIAAVTLLSFAPDAGAVNAGAFVPTSLFLQAGMAEEKTHAYVFGAAWDWPWRREFSHFTAGGYFEAAVGRWETEQDNVHGSAWATQIGLTPVLRVHPTGAARQWFAEIGVGANVILPLYRSPEKQFSTEFNFGDHFAVGRQFGKDGRHEISARIQHFSNGGIDHPNPGENFVQLRYLRRL